MQRRQSFRILAFLLLPFSSAGAVEPVDVPDLIAKPDAFPTLVHPLCSHCNIEANRRKDELRADDRVLCWMQVFTDGYINDGAIPLRFFLNKYRVLDDGWGQFVYDPDAGFARGFAPDDGPFRFHGWRNGVMVMKSNKDGTIYSCLTGIGIEGPRKGKRLEPRPTIVSDWGFWQKRYPQAVAYTMADKFKPVELPTAVHEDSRKSRRPADARLSADTPVLGVWDGKQARAYPIDGLEKAGVIHDMANGQPRVVLWYGPTRTAAAFRQPWGTSGLAGDVGWIFSVDPKVEAAPFVDKRTGLHWDITGRPIEGGPRLVWLDSVQVKWFAWAAEYPETSIYGKESAKADFKSLSDKSIDVAGAHGNLDVKARAFGILKAADPRRSRVTLLIDGETGPKEWTLRSGAEVLHAGWWGRLDQFSVGDRVWVWFETDRAKQPTMISLLADELSEQDLYAPAQIKAINTTSANTGTMTIESARQSKPIVRTIGLAKAEVYRGSAKAAYESLSVGEVVHTQTSGEEARLVLDAAAFEQRRTAQQAAIRKRWADDGLPGTLIFLHPERREIELMLDHESTAWGRLLQAGDNVTLLAAQPVSAVVRQLRPWRERTQVLLRIDGSDRLELSQGERVNLRLTVLPAVAEDGLPPGLGISRSKPERVEWLLSSFFCTCGMHDGCAGHFYTLAACNSGPNHPCGLAKRTREQVAEMIEHGQSDRQIYEGLLKERGPKLLRPHMLP